MLVKQEEGEMYEDDRPKVSADGDSFEYGRALDVLKSAIRAVEFYKDEKFNECNLPLMHKAIRSAFGYGEH